MPDVIHDTSRYATNNKFDPTSPFGGYKESGVGREGGLHGLDAYVKLGAG